MNGGQRCRVRVAAAELALLQAAAAAFGFNPRQKRGPDGRFIKMGGPGSAGGKRAARRKKPPKTYSTEMVWPAQIADLMDEVDGNSERDEFIRQALQGALTFAGTAVTFVARDDDTGKLSGAITAVEREDVPGKPYFLVDRAGAQGGGAGTALVREVVKYANDVLSSSPEGAVYAEATENSIGFWEDKMGFTPDPLGMGTEWLGLAKDDMPGWLATHGGER